MQTTGCVQYDQYVSWNRHGRRARVQLLQAKRGTGHVVHWIHWKQAAPKAINGKFLVETPADACARQIPSWVPPNHRVSGHCCNQCDKHLTEFKAIRLWVRRYSCSFEVVCVGSLQLIQNLSNRPTGDHRRSQLSVLLLKLKRKELNLHAHVHEVLAAVLSNDVQDEPCIQVIYID